MVLIGAALGSASCSKLKLDSDTRQTYEVVIRVSNGEQGRPVEGAQLQYNGQKVGVTGSTGAATLQFVGKEGETYDLHVECPAGLQSPAKPIHVTLRQLTSTKKPEFSAACPPATQVLVVAVRAENGPYLPVLYQGREVGRTDSAGAANVAFRIAPNETVELKLGTDDKVGERLRPQNPTATFTVKDHDELATFDQTFTLEPKRVFRGGGRVGPKKL